MRQDEDSALAFSMEGIDGATGKDRPAELVPFAWSPGWNSPSAWNKFQAEVGGAMRGGDSGKFTFASGAGSASYFTQVPEAFKAGAELRVVALQRMFGSEEQSALAEPIRKRGEPAFVAVNEADAAKAGLNGVAEVTIDGHSIKLPVKRTQIAAGTIGLPQGFEGIPFLAAGASARVGKGS
jgi:NADH-quinone oxidoreductase subunit G